MDTDQKGTVLQPAVVDIVNWAIQVDPLRRWAPGRPARLFFSHGTPPCQSTISSPPAAGREHALGLQTPVRERIPEVIRPKTQSDHSHMTQHGQPARATNAVPGGGVR